MRTTSPLAVLLMVLSVAVSAIPGRGEEPRFDSQKALALVRTLADDRMEGRKSGLPSGERAVQFIADTLRDWGLEPADEKGTFLQRFPLEDQFVVSKSVLEIVAGSRTRSFEYRHGIFDEWRVCDNSGSGAIRAEIVLAGFGIHGAKSGYEDYAGIDVHGKIVLINEGYPEKLAAAAGADLSIQKRIRDARQLGAAAVLIAPDPAPIGEQSKYPAWGRVDPKDYDPAFVAVGVNEAILAFLTDGLPLDPRTYYATLQAEGKPRPVATGVQARLEVKASLLPKPEAANVLAKIPGSDPMLRDEIVILGGHLDGLGRAPSGEICNGANDNASGAAVVMEAARTLKASGWRPRRTVLFALWGAEEIGCVGSAYYVAHPLYPLEKTVVNLNLDCVGQGTELGLGGTALATELFDFLKAKLPAEGMAQIVPRRRGGGSDQLSFLAQGVPAFHLVSLSNCLKIHSPGDDVELIRPEMLDKTGRFLLSATRLLADTDQNLIPKGRAALTKFRYEEIVNFRPVPLAEAAKLKDAANSDVDQQLVSVTTAAKAPPAEAKVAVAKELAAASANPDKALTIGLADAGLVRDDPEWLGLCAKLGLKFVLVKSADLEMAGAVLAAPSRRLLEAADRAKLVVVLDRLDVAKAAAVLPVLKRPCVFLTDELPAEPALLALKATRHVLGLRWTSGLTAEAYFQRLKAARNVLDTDRLIAWNEKDLRADGKADYLKLTDLLIRDGWGKEKRPSSRQSALADVWSSTWLRLVRGY